MDVPVFIDCFSSLSWAQDMVEMDEARYPVEGRHALPTTREELDLALGMGANTDDVDVIDPLPVGGTNGMQADQLDGDVEIHEMGDIAQTATATA